MPSIIGGRPLTPHPPTRQPRRRGDRLEGSRRGSLRVPARGRLSSGSAVRVQRCRLCHPRRHARPARAFRRYVEPIVAVDCEPVDGRGARPHGACVCVIALAGCPISTRLIAAQVKVCDAYRCCPARSTARPLADHTRANPARRGRRQDAVDRRAEVVRCEHRAVGGTRHGVGHPEALGPQIARPRCQDL